ncbi:MAG: serine/threonine-protein phosphatase [Planctomycetota bacterium]|nr:serine/threonine-protein phosphatase [Planctomycetota bacterium]
MLGKLLSLFGGDNGGQPPEAKAGAKAPASPDAPEKTGPFRPAPDPADENRVDEAALLAGELRAAKKIQMGLVPKTFPPIPGCLPFDLYATLAPAKAIGGDFYDFWLNGRELLTLVVGDVSGKGIPAALFMAVCRTYLRAFSRSVREPAKLLALLNDELSRHNESCMFVTLLCITVHIPTGHVEYANAGHNPPIIRRANGETFPLPAAENMPVGFLGGQEYETRTLDLDIGDKIFLYTDGMPEAFNADGAMLGEERTLSLFHEAGESGSARMTVGQLHAEIADFTGDAEQSDDITLLVYGQVDQSSAPDLRGEADASDALEGDSGVFSLSNLDEALPKPTATAAGVDLGVSLSRFGPHGGG